MPTEDSRGDSTTYFKSPESIAQDFKLLPFSKHRGRRFSRPECRDQNQQLLEVPLPQLIFRKDAKTLRATIYLDNNLQLRNEMAAWDVILMVRV